jgi:glycosyltransferase involved in cell wall biosynthesis
MRILFVHNGRERFVQDDLALLRKSFAVTDWYQPTRFYNPARLYQLVRSHDLVFSWFASWHALAPVWLARHMGKPAVTVVGGYDTACVPAAGYGLQRRGFRRLVAQAVIRWSTHLIAMSDAARVEAITNATADRRKITVIYPGVTPFPAPASADRESIVLTVGGVVRENLLRKGLLPFVQAAAYLSDVRFVLAGRWFDDSIDELRRAAGPNVELRGFVSDEELAQLYARASVYVQPSLHEGFGLSVAEAMSAGCIPIVTHAGALPEVVGDTGICLASNDPRQIAAGVQQGLLLSGQDRQRARARVLRLFPAVAREQQLLGLLQTLLRDRVTR